MPFQIVRNDITKMKVDAIVNAANPTLLGGGGVDGAIHSAAGPELLEECKTLHGCDVGEAKATAGYNLPAKYVIHTVGPIWHGGNNHEQQKLNLAYINSLYLAKKLGVKTIAFPLISSGVYGYPKAEALKVATKAITKFLQHNDMMVYLVIFDPASFKICETLFDDIENYIDDRYVAENAEPFYSEETPTLDINRADVSQRIEPLCESNGVRFSRDTSFEPSVCNDDMLSPSDDYAEICGDLIDKIKDESFSEMLLRKIDESGMKDSTCYKKANIDRGLFSKIRSNPQYKPSKATACAFAIALEMSIDETNELLLKAGYALSHSSKFDIIIEYFVTHGIYDIFTINEVLFAMDQATLGSK